ncbi:polyprenyl synthetase family protein [Myxococcota bacterium]|nr:polyprenyl synthetase family protein [Myxococcota bacterium]
MDALGYIEDCAPDVNAALQECLPAVSEKPATLHAAMRHLMFPAGKLFRPALAMAGAEAVSAERNEAIPLAVAVELVHTYSLVHDDLPCMDDDDERRGRPSVHVAFGEAVAVLAGDALLALAFEVLSSAPGDPCRILTATRELAAAAGSRALVGGQVADLEFAQGSDLTGADVESVHERKTAALIAASVAGGAALAGADEEQLACLRRFGRAVGIGFQIADDLLDRDDDDPCNLLRVMSSDTVGERAAYWLSCALREVEDWGETAQPLRHLARFAIGRST